MNLSVSYIPQGPHSHTLMTGEGSPKNFFGSEIFWVYKRRRDFFESRKNTGIFSVLCLLSAQINNNISAFYCLCGIFWGMLKKLRFCG